MAELPVTDAELLSIDLFAGDKDDGGFRTVEDRIVVTRKLHECRLMETHKIPVGTRARSVRSVMDGKWYGFYVCADCLERNELPLRQEEAHREDS